jgi:spore germination protein GerM
MLSVRSDYSVKQPRSFWLLGLITAIVMIGTNGNTLTSVLAAPIARTKIDRLAAVVLPKASVYWIQGNGNMHLIARTIDTPLNHSHQLTLATALDHLLNTPQTDNLRTTIPQKTQLLGLRTERNSVYINLSSEFATGGGSTSMTQRIAQVLYTATSLDREARVYLFINGEPVNEENPLGGEGLLLPHPLTRQDFDELFSR